MIVRMKHLDLVCVSAERERTLERLRALGAVHLDLASAGGQAVADVRGEIDEAEKAVRLILKARGKNPADEVRPRSVSEILALDADRATLLSERERLEREIKVYEPYGDFDPALAQKLLDKGVDLQDRLPAKLPAMRLGKMREKLVRVVNRIAVDEAKLAMADEQAIFAKHPALRARLEFEQAKELMSAQGAVAVISGWVPVSSVSCLASSARDNGWGVFLRSSSVATRKIAP